MPLITDWLMFGITTVYVIATIFICMANIKSAKASRDQIAESQRQFGEDQRIKLLPYFQITEISKPNRTDGWMNCQLSQNRQNTNCVVEGTFYFQIKNIGHDIAKEIEFQWADISMGTLDPFIVSLATGESRDAEFLIRASYDSVCPNNRNAILRIKYKDLFGTSYIQNLSLFFEISTSKIKFVKCFIDAPVLLNVLKED